MSRLPRLLQLSLAVVALAPFAVACDLLKGGDKADAAPVVVAPPATTAAATAAPVADPNAAPPNTGATPVAPLGAAQPATPAGTSTVKPVVTDGGTKPADAAAPAATPTPTFQIPTSIPGFDAGAFKPPAGFPSTLPTFPPPAK